MTFYERSKHYPPCLVRILARHKHGDPLTTKEIAQASGMDEVMVEVISHSTAWSHIDISMMERFLKGCGIDFCNAEDGRRVDDYLRHTPSFKYLRSSKMWEPYYKPMMMMWMNSYPPGYVLDHRSVVGGALISLISRMSRMR